MTDSYYHLNKNRKLRDWNFQLQGSWAVTHIQKFYRELQQAEIPFKPLIWISEEWFSPDNICGMAIPFYLFNSDLKKLEKLYFGKAYGQRPLEFEKLLRHEMGHVIENVYQTRQMRERVAIFGSSNKRYPASYRPLNNSKNYVQYLGENYAQSHSDEDFAETFATWLDPQSDWKRRYRHWPCFHKLTYMDRLMKEIIPRKRPKIVFKVIEPINENNDTLKDYVQKKRKRLGLKSRNNLIHYAPYKTLIRDNKQNFDRILAKHTQFDAFQRKLAFDDFLERNTQVPSLLLQEGPAHFKIKEIGHQLLQHALNLEASGGPRIYM